MKPRKRQTKELNDNLQDMFITILYIVLITACFTLFIFIIELLIWIIRVY